MLRKDNSIVARFPVESLAQSIFIILQRLGHSENNYNKSICQTRGWQDSSVVECLPKD